MKVSRRVFLGASAGLATVTACRQQQTASVSNQEKVLNLYSSRHYNTDEELYNNFNRITGVKVNLVEGKADELIERIKSEGSNSPADILITVDAGRIWRAEQAGIFAPVNSSTLEEKIPANLRHPENLWFGFSERARIVMYNKDNVGANQLSTYEDLADPKWRGKIAIRSSSNIYNQSLVASLIAVHGEAETEAWCRGLVANFARPPQGNDRAQIEAAASGIADIAIANTYYLATYAKAKEPNKQAIFSKIAPFFPNQNGRGAHVNISGGGLVKTSPNKEVAIQFLEYLASPMAQIFFSQGNNEYPVLPGTALGVCRT